MAGDKGTDGDAAGRQRPAERAASRRAAQAGASATGSSAERGGPARTGSARDGSARGSGRAAAARTAAARSGSTRTAEPRKPRKPRKRLTPADYRRRRLAALLIAVVVVVGLGLTIRVLLYDAGLADVEKVQVTGLVTVREADVTSAAAVTLGAPLAAVDTGGIASRVAQLPAVASVDVGRAWPHTVTVAVRERVPVATADTPNGVALVDEGGVPYQGTPPPGLPKLGFRGVGPDDPSTRAALSALTALPPAVRSQVVTVDVAVAVPGAPGQVSFGLTDDRQVTWGAPERAADKAAALVPLLTQPGHVYDVTSPDLPTIRR